VPDSKGLAPAQDDGEKDPSLDKQENEKYKPSILKLQKAKDAGVMLKDQIH